jgi:hypothetical protein
MTISVAIMPKMLYISGNGFYCTYCDYYFYPELDRSGLPDSPIKWIAHHGKVERLFPENYSNTADCPLVGKMFEIDVTKVYPEAREVGK